MKNNTFFNKILLAGGALLISGTFASCDNIAEDDRYIEVDAVVPERVVLIEDFTGQNCVNCPDAHEVIEALQQQYGDAVVPVSIHAGAFAISKNNPRILGLGTEEGTYYNNSYNISSWPQGVINGRGGACDYGTWASTVRAELLRPTTLSIDLDADLEGNEIKIDVELIPHEDIEGQLLIWVIEDGIVAQQISKSNGLMPEYVHNNVFRAAVNGVDGEKVSLEKSIHKGNTYSIPLRDEKNEKWNPDNISVIAFVKSADGVEQVAKAPLK
ncbi:MAG: Omp28 family outer membrane lipoprotein [Muribaculaceae bacterium]|nr:Omp28 family outer membrane lipoprotein [Muribaculaceae bacterium]